MSKEQTKSVDNSDKIRKIRNWSILTIILVVLGILIYFSCVPKYKTINVKDIDIRASELAITTNQTTPVTYIVKGTTLEDWEKNSYSYLIWGNSADHKTQYFFYANTNKGAIAFQITEDTTDPDNTVWTTNGGWSWSGNGSDTYKWLYNTSTGKTSLPPENTSIWTYVLQYGTTIILIAFLIWMWRKTSGAGMGENGESVFGMGKSQAKLAISNVKFNDVAGIKEEKEELIEIVDYLMRPAKYSAMGARTPKGVILYGPPGTGKTLLAKAVAGEAKVPFFQVSGSAFDDMLVGVGAKRVRDLFSKARKVAPSIVFIDEIDSVASKRGKFDMSGGGGVADQTINQLLAEMDGFNTKTGIVVMAATNRLDVLDEAILRPGRFDRHIQVNLPDIKEREEILKIHSKNKNISSSVSLSDIARRTPGMSGAQLENVLNEATLLAVRFNKNVVSISEIDEAIDRVIAGPAKKSRVLTEKEKRQIAIHEAGHALVGLYTKGGDVVEKITIIPRGMAAGYTISNPEKQETQLHTKVDLLAMIRTLVGGRAAEAIEYGEDDVSTGAANDLYRASNIARSMVLQLGMSNVGMTQLIPSEGATNAYQQKLYSEDTAKKADIEIEKILVEEYKKASKIINENKKELLLIVDTLMVLETIVKEQIDYIHKNKELPPEVAKNNENKENIKGTEENKQEVKKPKKTSKKKAS